MYKNKLRSLLALFGVYSVFFLPPFVPFITALLLSILFPAWEVILIGMLLDFTWLPVSPLHLPTATLVAIAMVWIFEPLRNEFLSA